MSHEPTFPTSRLAEEPVPRRDFLGRSALITAGSAMLFALGGMLRLPKAAVLPSPSKRFRVSLPESLGAGEPFLPKARSVAVFRDAEGVFAISTVCTHLGCIVRPAPDGFHCPCHGSRFGPAGELVRGPAPRALNWLAVSRAEEGVYEVDEGNVVPPGTRAKA